MRVFVELNDNIFFPCNSTDTITKMNPAGNFKSWYF